MKVKIMISILSIIIIVLLAIILSGDVVIKSTASNNRIVKVIDEGQYEVWCDTETKVLYLQSRVGTGYQGYGGLTVLVDQNGNPLLYEDNN